MYSWTSAIVMIVSQIALKNTFGEVFFFFNFLEIKMTRNKNS